jgi:membrane protein YdbS with pleckstrin-like domain
MEELLRQGEELKMEVRKHWIVYVGDFLAHGFGGLFFIVLAHYLITVKGILPIPSLTYSDVAMILMLFVIVFWCSFFFSWTKNYLDVWYVTDKHIVAVNQKEIFEREEAFMELVRIQDVFFENNGPIATLLGFGKIRVQSAGTEQEFIMNNVKDVQNVTHKIITLRDIAQGKGEGGRSL